MSYRESTSAVRPVTGDTITNRYVDVEEDGSEWSPKYRSPGSKVTSRGEPLGTVHGIEVSTIKEYQDPLKT